MNTKDDIMNLKSIILPEGSTVYTKTILVEDVQVRNKEVNFISKSDHQLANLRTLQWFYYQKNALPILPAYRALSEGTKQGIFPLRFPLQVTFIVDSDTNIAFSHTKRKLIPLTASMFQDFMLGRKPTEPKPIPFNLGTHVMQTSKGTIIISFGYYNGDSGISATLNGNPIRDLNTKHLGNDINTFCVKLKEILKL